MTQNLKKREPILAYKCPVPGCNHVGQVLTKAHFKLVHNMSKDEAIEKYGAPEQIIKDHAKARKNMKDFVPFYGVVTWWSK